MGTEPGDNVVVVGVLEAWRYGWAAAVVVRVDYCGEIYARRAYDDDDVEGVPALRELTGDEEEEASSEHARRYAAGQ